MWLAHDDVMGKEYISRCVQALKQDSGAVLAFANANYIDDKGSVIKRLDFENSGSSERPSVRFSNILHDAMCDPICGLMSTEVLKQTRLHGGFADSDRVLLVEMGLRGRFSLVPEHVFSRRMHAEQSLGRTKTLGRGRYPSIQPKQGRYSTRYCWKTWHYSRRSAGPNFLWGNASLPQGSPTVDMGAPRASPRRLTRRSDVHDKKPSVGGPGPSTQGRETSILESPVFMRAVFLNSSEIYRDLVIGGGRRQEVCLKCTIKEGW